MSFFVDGCIGQSAKECEMWQLGRRALAHSISFPLCSVIILMYQHVEFLTISNAMSRHGPELYVYEVGEVFITLVIIGKYSLFL